MHTITVNLSANRAYPVLIGNDVLAQTANYAAPVNAVITNQTIYDLYGERLNKILKDAGKKANFILIADGEQHKDIHSLQTILDQMFACQLRRDSGVIALGGGVIGDLAGFAAAVYMRGVAVVQVPTTLLAQVDAAIGGKTGINHSSGKNLIGAFHQPRAVIADTSTLASLPAREYSAGLAEVVKYGLLGDAKFFSFLEQQQQAIVAQDSETLEQIISTSAQSKATIVAADETEQSGQRALLNLGHTFAHAAEAVCGYGEWKHGEAVAFGLVAAAKLSEKICDFAASDTARIIALLTALKLPTHAPKNVTAAQLLTAMGLDKKNVTGGKRFILMRGIGDAFMGEADNALVLQILEGMQ
ncbi:MAG: 3-dehydroquinate synthase [Proteobacteria bacterium]|nr:3-dehydroquinate synthase [Pseudomonadota bacterium]